MTIREFILVAIFVLAVSFQGNAPQQPKTYNMTLTMDEWVKTANGIQYTMNRLRQSDLPAKEVSLITDSVLAPFISQIQTQIGSQVQAEEKAKADAQKPKADSTNKKKQ